jgi:type II secretory pathway component PulF
MNKFRYQAVDGKGRTATGEIEAATRGEALAKLQRQGLRPVRVDAGAGGSEPGKTTKKADGEPVVATGETPKLNRAQVMLFTEEMAELLEAGLQLEPALKVMEGRQEGGPLAAVAAALRQRIREGASLAVSMRACAAGFDELYRSMVAIGETSGALPEILRRQARNLAQMQELQSRVVQSLIYPAFLASAGAVLVGIFMTVLVPQLTGLLTKTGGELPFVTRALIWTSHSFTTWGWIAILALIGLVIAVWVSMSEGESRLARDKFVLRAPLAGPIIQASQLAMLCQSLSTLVINGVPLLTGLQLVRDVTGNRHARSVMDRLVERVADGAPLSRAMSRFDFFPPRLVDTLAIGEQAGNLGAALEKAASRYDAELGRRIARVTALIQPAVIVIMALLVGAVAFSMISGIFTTVSSLRVR